jgi:hypothetical protein
VPIKKILNKSQTINPKNQLKRHQFKNNNQGNSGQSLQSQNPKERLSILSRINKQSLMKRSFPLQAVEKCLRAITLLYKKLIVRKRKSLTKAMFSKSMPSLMSIGMRVLSMKNCYEEVPLWRHQL